MVGPIFIDSDYHHGFIQLSTSISIFVVNWKWCKWERN